MTNQGELLGEDAHQATTVQGRGGKKTPLLEMKCFIRLVLLVGIIHKPSVEMYWATDELNATPDFQTIPVDFEISTFQ